MSAHDESFSPVPVDRLDDDALREYLRGHGLTLKTDEARRVASLLGREPSLTELTLFDTMWSEHCSYKSSRPHLKKHLPTEGPNVVVGPVEDAGIIDFGEHDGRRWGIIFAHESHNHPSQVMPVEGAATGIGGIVRDVYCMGGEVIATLDPLRFGWPVDAPGETGAAHRIDIARGVVTGIWEYGNALGVPNLGGDIYFHESYNENCLVNVVAVGLVDQAHITHSRVPKQAAEEPYDLILVGKPTDWSGMGGAAFASADLDAAAAHENKGSVQTPDPFLKRILTVANRAALQLARDEGVEIGFKDLGAGGVACVTSELVDAGGFGCDVDLALVHQVTGLPARVCACSETQERYGLAVPARLTAAVLKIYNEDFALPTLYEGACARRIGAVTQERRYVLRLGDRIVCDAPVETITEGIRYDRVAEAPARREVPLDERLTEAPAAAIADEWLALMAHPNLASREYVYRHYDAEVQANTIIRPGEADAGVVAPLAGCRRGVALSADGNPLLGLADPWSGGAAAVLEACRNVACVGGEPAAITDCLNFGNPENPHAFWQFSEAVRGVGDACRGIGLYAREGTPLPVVSGNVSLYNQSSSGRAIAPSPIVACVGLVADHAHSRSQRFKSPGDIVLLVGRRRPETAGSVYLDLGFTAGRPAVPPLDFAEARRGIRAVCDLVAAGLVTAAHDIGDGGLAACLAEMAIGLEGAGLLGAEIALPVHAGLTAREYLFGEAGGFVLTVSPGHLAEAQEKLAAAGAEWWQVGAVTSEPRLCVREVDGDRACRDRRPAPGARLAGGAARVVRGPCRRDGGAGSRRAGCCRRRRHAAIDQPRPPAARGGGPVAGRQLRGRIGAPAGRGRRRRRGVPLDAARCGAGFLRRLPGAGRLLVPGPRSRGRRGREGSAARRAARGEWPRQAGARDLQRLPGAGRGRPGARPAAGPHRGGAGGEPEPGPTRLPGALGRVGGPAAGAHAVRRGPGRDVAAADGACRGSVHARGSGVLP
jgi:phosphoribosylformylglycinamidine synthase II